MAMRFFLRVLLVAGCVVCTASQAYVLYAQDINLDPVLAKASKALRAERYEEAEKFIAPLLNGDSPSLFVLLLKAEILDASGTSDTAIQYYERAEALDKASIQAVMGQVSAIGGQKRNSLSPGIEYEIKAAPLIKRAISMAPSNSYDYLARGVAFKLLGELEKALEDFNKAIELDRSIPDAFTLRTAVFFKKQEFDKAIAENAQALDLDPTFVQALINRGAAHRKMGNIDVALADYSKAMKISPSNPEVYFNRGVIYQKKAMYAQAIDEFSSAIRFDPKYVGAYMNCGASQISLGNISAGKKDFEQAFRLDPLSEAGQMAGRNLSRLKERGY